MVDGPAANYPELVKLEATAYGAASLSVESWETYRKTQKITWRGSKLDWSGFGVKG